MQGLFAVMNICQQFPVSDAESQRNLWLRCVISMFIRVLKPPICRKIFSMFLILELRQDLH
jgi:hypothetical protein